MQEYNLDTVEEMLTLLWQNGPANRWITYTGKECSSFSMYYRIFNFNYVTPGEYNQLKRFTVANIHADDPTTIGQGRMDLINNALMKLEEVTIIWEGVSHVKIYTKLLRQGFIQDPATQAYLMEGYYGNMILVKQ